MSTVHLRRLHVHIQFQIVSWSGKKLPRLEGPRGEKPLLLDWQTADPNNGRFHSRIRENGLGYGETKGTRLKGTQLRLNSVDPAVFTHTGVARGPVRVSSPSPLPLTRSHLATPSTVSTYYPPPIPPRLSFLPSSLGRVLRETLFGSFDSLILSSPSSAFPFRTSPESHSFYRCLTHLLVAKGEGGERMSETWKERNRSRGSDGGGGVGGGRGAMTTTAAARWQRVRTKKGQSGSGEPDCSQRDLIMNHNERAGAYKRAMESRISRWRGDGSHFHICKTRARVYTTYEHTLSSLHNEKT